MAVDRVFATLRVSQSPPVIPPESGYLEQPKSHIVQIPTLEALRNLEMMAMGRFYIDEYGNARYEGRYARNV